MGATLTLVYVVAGKLGRTGRPQRELPRSKVVKTLNTCNCRVMVDPARSGRDHDVFICGNDAGAKETVKALLRDFGWETIIDLGDITAARATEQLMPIWPEALRNLWIRGFQL